MSNSEKYVCTNVPLQIKEGAYLKWHQMIKNMLFCMYSIMTANTTCTTQAMADTAA